MKASTDSLLTVIGDILDFSKIEAGKLDLDEVDFALRDALESIMKSFALSAHQKGLELACSVGPEVPDIVRGDPLRLRQVVSNLVGNALKFTERGEVVLRVETRRRDAETILLHFLVQDTGIGIPPEKQKTIFEPFSQADGSMTRKYGGTGLGLTVSSRLVAMMGGEIWVESEAGRGSRFHFTVRLGTSKNVPAVKPVTATRLEDVPVLVVDDNATNRRILSETLSGWDMRVVAVESGQEALAALEKAAEACEPFQLMITDAHMPGMDGFMLTEEVAHNPKLVAATIMMLTSSGQQGDAARCRKAGVAAYLTKPVRQAELRDMILLALDRKARPSPAPALITENALRERRAAASRRVLVAEDNVVNQTLARRLLEKQGHTVVVASNGREVLQALEKEAFERRFHGCSDARDGRLRGDCRNS